MATMQMKETIVRLMQSFTSGRVVMRGILANRPTTTYRTQAMV